jgi:hypothetical protein
MHFTVLVIGDNPEKQLAPFNAAAKQDDPDVEFEFEDMTDEYASRYENETVEIVRLPDGKWKFYRPWLFGWNTDDEKEMPREEAKFSDLYLSYAEFLREYIQEEPDEAGRFGYWHNPKGKWDYYVLGGRWRGFFKAKPGIVGRVGESVGPWAYGHADERGYFDQMRKSAIDFEAMRIEPGEAAALGYDAFHAAIKDTGLPPRYRDVLQKHEWDLDAARVEYQNLPAVRAIEAADLMPESGDPVDFYDCSREVFVHRARRGVCMTHAVLKDGVWYEQESVIGWLDNACEVLDRWQAQFWGLLDAVSEDTLLSVYDYHL